MCGDGAVAVADVSVDLLQPLDNPAFASCGSQNPVQIPSFKSQLTGLFPIGEPLNIIKAVNGTLGLDVVDGGIDTGMFDATADPTIQIDPSFAFADDFELDFSPGFSAGTTSDVPEPSSLTLLAAAFIVLAIIPRRSLLSPRTARLPLTFAQGSA